jgi:hypothetical protein
VEEEQDKQTQKQCPRSLALPQETRTCMHPGRQACRSLVEGWADRGSHTRLLRWIIDLFAKCERSSLW